MRVVGRKILAKGVGLGGIILDSVNHFVHSNVLCKWNGGMTDHVEPEVSV